MGRIRTVKPEFNSHEGLSSLSCQAHLLAEALLCYADDEGYFNANPGLVRAGTCPLREDFQNISGLLTELSGNGYIRMGTCSGKHYGQIVHFSAHQKISHATPSKISSLPIEWNADPAGSGKTPENSRKTPKTKRKALEILRPEQGTGNREQGREQGTGKGTGNREPADADETAAFEFEPSPDSGPTATSQPQMELFAAVKKFEEAPPGDARPIGRERHDAIREVFAFYLTEIGRNPKTYTLTNARRVMAHNRLDEALGMTAGNLHGAGELLKVAVEQMALSDFHMGRTERTGGKRYCDWEVLFRSAEQFQKWLQIAEEREAKEAKHA